MIDFDIWTNQGFRKVKSITKSECIYFELLLDNNQTIFIPECYSINTLSSIKKLSDLSPWDDTVQTKTGFLTITNIIKHSSLNTFYVMLIESDIKNFIVPNDDTIYITDSTPKNITQLSISDKLKVGDNFLDILSIIVDSDSVVFSLDQNMKSYFLNGILVTPNI
jgi:hypothetical protein